MSENASRTPRKKYVDAYQNAFGTTHGFHPSASAYPSGHHYGHHHHASHDHIHGVIQQEVAVHKAEARDQIVAHHDTKKVTNKNNDESMSRAHAP